MILFVFFIIYDLISHYMIIVERRQQEIQEDNNCVKQTSIKCWLQVDIGFGLAFAILIFIVGSIPITIY